MALTTDSHLAISSETGGQPRVVLQAHPQLTNTVIYKGAALMTTSGNIRPLLGSVASSTFAGFAAERSDSTGIATGVKRPDIIEEGYVKLTITTINAGGVLTPGQIVYATDDNTWVIDDTAVADSIVIGRIHTVIGADGYKNHAANTVIVYFQATAMQV